MQPAKTSEELQEMYLYLETWQRNEPEVSPSSLNLRTNFSNDYLLIDLINNYRNIEKS